MSVGKVGVIQSLRMSVSWGAVWVRGVCVGMAWGCEGSKHVFTVWSLCVRREGCRGEYLMF